MEIDELEELLSLSRQQEEKLSDDVLICECFCVNVADIRETCPNGVDLDVLAEKYGLGSGCRSCLMDKDSWLNKI